MLLKEALPDVAAEMSHGFRLEGRSDLAEQVERLELVDRCPCSDAFCATFYTQPNESWEGRGVERFFLDMPGLTCLYTVDGVVAWVEVLWRPDVRDRLRSIFPQALQQTAGHDSFLGLQADLCPAAAEIGRSAST